MLPLKGKDSLFDKLVDPASYDKIGKIIDQVKDKLSDESKNEEK
jgi:hypothetical protein